MFNAVSELSGRSANFGGRMSALSGSGDGSIPRISTSEKIQEMSEESSNSAVRSHESGYNVGPLQSKPSLFKSATKLEEILEVAKQSAENVQDKRS